MSRASLLRDRLARLYAKGALRPPGAESYAPGDGRRRWVLTPAGGEAERVLTTVEAEAFALGAEAAFAAFSRRLHDAGLPYDANKRVLLLHEALTEQASELDARADELPREGDAGRYRARLEEAARALRGLAGAQR